MKYLGAITNNKLNVRYTEKKMVKKVYVISRETNQTNRQRRCSTRHQQYLTLIIAIQFYFRAMFKSYKSYKVRPRLKSVTTMLNEQGFYNAKHRITYNTIKLIHKAEYKKLPKRFV